MVKKQLIELNLNGDNHEVLIEPYESLNSVIREKVRLTGTKRGCDTGGCGVCTVIIDGRAVYSCMYPAIRAVGKKVVTIEGLSRDGELHPLQDAFVRMGGIQCGYCTPGMIMASLAILQANPRASEEDIREDLAGNLCRCTGYVKILGAVLEAARQSAMKVQTETDGGLK